MHNRINKEDKRFKKQYENIFLKLDDSIKEKYIKYEEKFDKTEESK